MVENVLIVSEDDLRRLIREEMSSVVDSGEHTTKERDSGQKTFIMADDVIDMTGYSQSTLARKIKEGVLPIARKEGKRNLFDKHEVEELINLGKLKRNKTNNNLKS